MIDTVKFLIPIEDITLVQRLQGNLKRLSKENLRDGKLEFEFFADSIELGSHSRKVSFKTTDNPRGLFVELSLPKYEKGNNVEMIRPEQLEEILAKLYVDICNHMDYPLPPIATWPVYRLDVCYNWIFEDKDSARYAMDFIRRIDYPRKQKYVYDTSVMYRGSAYTIKFYLKGPEFFAHDFKVLDFEEANFLQSWADRIVRFEVNFKRVYLQQFLDLDRVFTEHISEESTILNLLNFYLKKVFAYINTESMNNEKIKQILFDNFGKSKATRLYQFYRDYYFNPEMKDMLVSNGGLNRSTIYRYKKDLKDVGIGISVDYSPDTKDLLEKLIIPSPDSRFDLFDYKNH